MNKSLHSPRTSTERRRAQLFGYRRDERISKFIDIGTNSGNLMHSRKFTERGPSLPLDHIATQETLGEYCDTQPGGHSSVDSRSARSRKGNGIVDPSVGQDWFAQRTIEAVLTKSDQRDDTVEVRSLTTGEPAELIGPQHDIIGTERLLPDLYDDNVEVATVEILEQTFAVFDDKLDTRRRVDPCEPTQDGSHVARANFLVRAESDGAGEVGTHQASNGPIMYLDDRSGVVDKCSAVAREPYRMTLANKERTSNTVLETPDLPADSRLAEMQRFSCSSHATLVEDR